MLSLDNLCRSLGYTFQQPELLSIAVTHRSAAGQNNERLEFLGDAILSFVIATELYQRFPQATEGELSRLRASLVKGDTLAGLARSLSLGDYLSLGTGEMKSGGYRRSSILADAFEAIIGAMYLDGGIEASRTFLLQIFSPQLDAINLQASLKDPKTRLQEYLQAKGMELPQYEVISIDGQAHQQVFKVRCSAQSLMQPIFGSGSSRRKAEQAAAAIALEQLEP